MRRRSNIAVAAAAILTCAAGVPLQVRGAVAQESFTTQNTGILRFQNVGGVGLTGQWNANSSVPDVVAGDLAAPAATHFNLAQPAGTTAQRVAFDNALQRQNGADLAAPMTGTVWGTFLVNTGGTGSAGIGINSVVTFASFSGRPHLLATGSNLFFDGADAEHTATATGVVPAGADALILTRLVFDGAEGFTIDAWVDPDLTAALPAPQLSSLSSTNNALAMNRIGVGGTLGTSAGSIDFLTFSNDADAYLDVTGQPFPGYVPEPASLGLLTLAGMAFARRRR